MEAMAKKLRRHIITMTGKAGSGHPGGSLSAVEIVTALYFKIMRHKPQDPQWAERDRFILSKGHAAPLLYATLAECGYLPIEELITLRQLDSRLQGHTDQKVTPGVEMSAGALGQGLSFAIGVALAGRRNFQKYRVYVLWGDGVGMRISAGGEQLVQVYDVTSNLRDDVGYDVDGSDHLEFCARIQPDRIELRYAGAMFNLIFAGGYLGGRLPGFLGWGLGRPAGRDCPYNNCQPAYEAKYSSLKHRDDSFESVL